MMSQKTKYFIGVPLLLACFLLANGFFIDPRQKIQKTISSNDSSCLHLNMSRAPLTLDSRKTCDHLSFTLEYMLFEGLMKPSENGEITFGLAESYEISEDCLTYIFHLRPSFWSDGEPVTAYDFERTWKEILTPSFPSQSPNLLYAIEGALLAKKGELDIDSIGVMALDSLTLQVKLSHPTPYFLELTAFCALFPTPEKMGTMIDEIVNTSPSSLISNGPYLLKDFKTASHYTLVKNPHYWDKNSISIETIDISLIDNDMTAYQLFKLGKLDMLGLSFSQIPRDAVFSLKEEGIIQVVPIGATSLVQFNTLSSPFSNRNFRKAIAYAIDRNALCTHITCLGEEIADGLVARFSNTSGKAPFFSYDPKLAKHHLKLALDELNLSKKDLQEIRFLYTPSDQSTRIVLAIASQLQTTLGITLVPDAQEFRIFLSKLRMKDFECSLSAWIYQFDDPINILERFKTSKEATNDTGWSNPSYTEYLELAESTMDFIRREELLRAAESIFMEDLPQIPLYYWNFAYIKHPNIEGFQTTRIGIPLVNHIKKTTGTGGHSL